MQRTRFSKILQTDFPGSQDRLPGNHILQSHGNSVSRGDLITQENIMDQALWTVTINKDNFSQLCTVGNPGSLPSLYGGDYVSNSQMAVDSNGIYVSSYGTDPGGDHHARYHGPFFYTFFPTQVGNPGQYLYVKVKYKTDNFSYNAIFPVFIRVGFSFLISYYYQFDSSSTKLDVSFYNSTTNNFGARRTESFPPNTMAVHEFKFYHYTNNTYKTYLDGVIKRNENDPIALDTPQNSLTCGIFQYFEAGHDFDTPYFRLQELIISTDPSYDPQP